MIALAGRGLSKSDNGHGCCRGGGVGGASAGHCAS